jgi:hypothetical protein
VRPLVVVLVLRAAVHAEDPVPALLAQLDSAKARDRVLATRALGRLDGDRALTAVQRAQLDESAEVQHEAALALARAGRAEAATVGILVRSLDHDDWYVRWQACLGLKGAGPVGAKQSLPALVKALGDGPADVGREAALALAAVGPRDRRALAALAAALTRQQTGRPALHALAQSGPSEGDPPDVSGTVLAHLVRSLVVGDEDVRNDARKALSALGFSQLACLVTVDTWEWTHTVNGVLTDKKVHHATKFGLPSDDKPRDWDDLFRVLTGPDAAPILNALSTIQFANDAQDRLQETLRGGRLHEQRCAVVLLPHLVTHLGSAEATLMRAGENPDLQDLAARALRDLAARK